MLWHTVFDAATASNAGLYLNSDDESNEMAITIAFVLAIVVIGFSRIPKSSYVSPRPALHDVGEKQKRIKQS